MSRTNSRNFALPASLLAFAVTGAPAPAQAAVGVSFSGPLLVLASPMFDKYAALGGAGGFLGAATTTEKTAPDGVGAYQHFEGGSIYWSLATGAREVHGLIRARWAALGWEKGWHGYPMTDEIDKNIHAYRPEKPRNFQLDA